MRHVNYFPIAYTSRQRSVTGCVCLFVCCIEDNALQTRARIDSKHKCSHNHAISIHSQLHQQPPNAHTSTSVGNTSLHSRQPARHQHIRRYCEDDDDDDDIENVGNGNDADDKPRSALRFYCNIAGWVVSFACRMALRCVVCILSHVMYMRTAQQTRNSTTTTL